MDNHWLNRQGETNEATARLIEAHTRRLIAKYINPLIDGEADDYRYSHYGYSDETAEGWGHTP